MPRESVRVRGLSRFLAGRLMSPLVLSIVLAVAGCSGGLQTGRPSLPQLADPGAPPPADVSGRFEGIYHTHPEMMHLVLELRTGTDGVVEGEVSFARLVEPEHFRVGSGVTGSFAVRGSYDPAIGVLDLQPQRWIERPTTAAPRAHPIRAVYDTGHGAFAGLFSVDAGDRYFAIARPERAEQLLLEPARQASVRRQVQRLPFGLGGRTETQTILDWAGQLTTEYPGVDPYRETIPESENLFADSHFEPYFGTTYDRLNPLKRREIFRQLRREQILQPFVGLAAAFQDTGLPETRRVTVMVLAHRILRSWLEGAELRLESLPATPESWAALARTEASGERIAEVLFPSERAAFADASAASVRQFAGRLLERRLAEFAEGGGDLSTALRVHVAIQGGAAGSREGVRTDDGRLIERVPDIVTLGALSHPEVRAALEPAAARAIHRMMDEAVIGDRTRVDALGTGLDALQAGARWYTGAYPLYAQLPSTAEVDALFESFEARRSALLRSHADALTARIRDAETAQAVDQVLAGYVGLPSDWEHPVGSRLLDLGTFRSNELRAIEARDERWARAITKAALALAGEITRRSAIENENVFLLVLGTAGRDLALHSALRDAFPDQSDSVRRFMARGLSNLIAGDGSSGGMAIALSREALVQWWESEYPEMSGAAAFADFGVDVALAMRRWNR